MKIFSNLSQVLLDIDVDDNSYRYRSIMGDHKVVLHFSMAESIEIPVGSYIQYQGQTFTLYRPENFKKNGTRKFEYEITFGSSQELLKQFKFKFLSTTPYKLKFPLTARPKMFLDLLVQNLNLNDSGWSVGSFVDATERAISFNHDDCFSVLNRLADEFDTEWEIVGKTIHLRKTEHYKDSPLPLSYGKGNGFKTGVGRTMQGDRRPVTMLYVQGGDRNIDRANYYSTNYKSETLLLPMNQTFSYEGRTYKTDEYGMYITRADKPLTVVSEDSYDGSAFYPSQVGKVSAVETKPGTDNEGKPVTFYDIIDSTIPDDLDFSKCTIKGEKVTIIFQSGKLTGKEFDIVTDDEGNLTGYIHAERRFKLVPANMDGVTMPNESWCPSIDDKYAVFHIALPDSYIRHDATQTGASWDMFKEAVRYMYENEEEKFSFTGELDGIWSKKNWLSVGAKLIPGSYILFSDPQFQPQGIPIRITGITDYINKPYSPTIELSNAPVAGYLSTELNKIKGEEVVNESLYKQAVQYTKRRFRDAVETQKMLEGAVEGFEAGINPVWIKTMSLLAGSEDLQFRFVVNRNSPVEVNMDFRMNQSTKIFTATALNSTTYLQHMTLGIKEVSNNRKPSDYKFWKMGNYTSPPLTESDTPYYLYAICSKTSEVGSFELFPDPQANSNANYYFLVGTLGTEMDGERSFTTLYGFTEILPGRITTKKIVSDDGRTYFDLSTGEIGGVIRFSGGSTGYNNLSDRPNLEAYATYNYLNTVKNGLEDQIDGKVETWFQNENPWNSWPSNTEYHHVGDLWYKMNTKELFRYKGPSANIWDRVEDKDAIEAMSKASEAKDTADGKRRVFVATPYPPYDVGDLWTDKQKLYRCRTKKLSGSFSMNDWEDATYYDNTKTVIDGGVITAGKIQLAGDGGSILAGITGSGDNESVRFWSGKSYDDRNIATFRVLQNGSVYSKQSFKVENANGTVNAGFQSSGVTGDSVRLWVGNASPTAAPFRVTENGSMYASKGQISGFKISTDGIENPSIGMALSSIGALHFNESTSRFARIGSSVMAPSTGGNALLFLNDSETGLNDVRSKILMILSIGRSAYSNVPQRWIVCNHDAGWGSNFIVESRYFGDANGMERTVINTGQMMNNVQLQNNYSSLGASGSMNGKPLYWDANSGYIYAKL